MTKMKRLAVILAVLVLFVSQSVTAETAEDDPILVTVNGKPIRWSETRQQLIESYYNGEIEDITDIETILLYQVQEEVITEKLRSEGYCDFTDAEMEAFRAEAADELENMIAGYVEYYLPEDTDEARETTRLQAEEFYEGEEEEILKWLLLNAAFEKWVAGFETEPVTEEDVKAIFEAYAAEDEELFAEDAAMYEYYTYYYGYDSFYIPAGYRNVLRLLLTVEDELLSAWVDACVAEEEASAGDGNADAAGQAHAERETREALILESLKEKTDEIGKKLESGAEFSGLIRQYGEDPEMSDETGLLESGYAIHPDSIIYDPYMIAAVFGDGMTAPGCWVGPVVAQEGVSYYYYLSDQPAGPIELTEEVLSSLRDAAESQRMNDTYQALVEAWISESDVVYNTEAIENASAEMAALLEE